MTDWIKGRELLGPPYNFTRRGVFNAVKEGILVPFESPDGAETNRVWRVFPTPELQKEWLGIRANIEIDQEPALERAKEYSQKTDEEIVEKDRFFRLEFLGEQNSEEIESEKQADLIKKIPELRQKWAQQIIEIPLQIKNLESKLENEFSPIGVWKDLDLGPAQQEALMERLLDVWYVSDRVEAISGAKPRNQFIPEAKKPKLAVSPGTRWQDIKITLISDDTVRIKTPDWEKLFTYHELGLSDKRKGDAPKLLWGLLKVFAQNQGFILRDNTDYSSKLPDTAKALNRHLKELFGINDSIYQGHYKKEGGYRTKIFFSSKEDLSKHFGQTDKKVTVPDVKGLTKDKATGTPANSGKVIECKDEIKDEIEDIFAQAQDWENCSHSKKSRAE